MQDTGEKDEKEREKPGLAQERQLEETLRKFQLQTGLDAGSPILSFMRLALKASAPAGQPRRDRRPPAPPRADSLPVRQAGESYKPITPSSSAWVLVMVAAALLGLLFSWLARTGALN
jgi:hypothetical protein